MSDEKLGIEEVKAVVDCGLKIGELVDALSDGIGLGDLGALLRAAKSVKPAFDAIKSGKLIPEVKDLSDEEKADLKAFVADDFDIENDALEAVVEKALSVVIDLSALIQAVA